MAEPLDSIVSAFQGRDYRVSVHVWENFVSEPDKRPMPSTVVRALTEDDPRVVSHDRNNPRGSSCDVHALDDSGRLLLATIGYGSRPITLVTAYYLEEDQGGSQAQEADPDYL